MLLILLISVGSVTFSSAGSQPRGKYYAIPGICRAPDTLVPSLINDFPALEHVQPYVQGLKKFIMPYVLAML